jgi:hypothetical protein
MMTTRTMVGCLAINNGLLFEDGRLLRATASRGVEHQQAPRRRIQEELRSIVVTLDMRE